MFAASTSAAVAAVIYVNAAATGSNNGTSWATAYTSLQSALTASASGDEIWVAAATYKPTATTDRTIGFALKNGVGVYGGFNGTETQRSQRDPAVNVTILSGDIGTPGVASDNSYHVVTADATVTSSGVLDGFPITAGQADGSAPNDEGAGMWDNGGAPTLGHSIITSNVATSRGGGLRVISGAPTILNCSFISNSVGFGGAGGGLFAGAGSTIYAQDCIFRFNTISSGTCTSDCGAGLEISGGNTLINCVIAQNNPTGAQFNDSGNIVDNCTFSANARYGVSFALDGNNVTNTILWGDGVGEIFLAPGFGSVSTSYCDIQGGGFFGTGNIEADPLFLAPPNDLRLGASSPAVDAGDNPSVPAGVTTDLAGLPRFSDDPCVPDTGCCSPPIVDMGAYERSPLAQPVITAPVSVPVGASGIPASVEYHAGSTWFWTLTGGTITAGQTTNQILFTAGPPGTTMLCTVIETACGYSSPMASTSIQVDFLDEPPSDIFHDYVVKLARNGVTSGCGGGNYCPGDPVTRAQMAVFLLRAEHGSSYTPPACAGIFTDVECTPMPAFAADWIEQLYSEGITGGCATNPLQYCPDSPVTRAQMAVFLLKAEHGSSYAPPACAGIFGDVECSPTPAFAVDWIEQLSQEGIAAGCQASPPLYCPNNPNTRGQMAVFLVTTFNLQ